MHAISAFTMKLVQLRFGNYVRSKKFQLTELCKPHPLPPFLLFLLYQVQLPTSSTSHMRLEVTGKFLPSPLTPPPLHSPTLLLFSVISLNTSLNDNFRLTFNVFLNSTTILPLLHQVRADQSPFLSPGVCIRDQHAKESLANQVSCRMSLRKHNFHHLYNHIFTFLHVKTTISERQKNARASRTS